MIIIILQNLKHLESLNIYNTRITKLGLEQLGQMSSLNKLYIWKTDINSDEITITKKMFNVDLKKLKTELLLFTVNINPKVQKIFFAKQQFHTIRSTIAEVSIFMPRTRFTLLFHTTILQKPEVVMVSTLGAGKTLKRP